MVRVVVMPSSRPTTSSGRGVDARSTSTGSIPPRVRRSRRVAVSPTPGSGSFPALEEDRTAPRSGRAYAPCHRARRRGAPADETRGQAMVLAEWQVGQVFWSFLWFFMFFIWIWLLIMVFSDIFRDHTMGGFAKT